jgi:hypothetical protein
LLNEHSIDIDESGTFTARVEHAFVPEGGLEPPRPKGH